MTTLAARFVQSPAETKRYVMNFTLDLTTGEGVVSTVAAITQTAGAASPALVVSGITLLPPVSAIVPGFVFFVSGGVNNGQYEIQFLTTTTTGQVLEDVVSFILTEKI